MAHSLGVSQEWNSVSYTHLNSCIVFQILSKVLSDLGLAQRVDFDKIDVAPEERESCLLYTSFVIYVN